MIKLVGELLLGYKLSLGKRLFGVEIERFSGI
jgi:hypothetical protein